MADFLEGDNDTWLEGVEPEKQEEVIDTPEPPVEAEAPAEAEQEQPEPEAPPVEEKFNPTLYREMKEERAKRQAAERELEQLRANAPKQEPAKPVQAPDPYEDPVGYNAYVQSTLQEQAWQMRAEMSGRFAEQVHGKEKVEAAVAWARAEGAKDPTLGSRVKANSDPVGYVVQEYERSRTLEALGGKSLDDYLQEQAIAKGWIVSQPEGGSPPSIQKPSTPVAPKGLATAPGKGGASKAPQGADWGEFKFALDQGR